MSGISSRTAIQADEDARPAVTVVVPTKNAARTLRACLASLRNQTHPCLVVVVDNFSADGTDAIAARDADRLLTAGPERSAQRNLGARAHPAPVIGFIDADMYLEPDVVAEAVAALDEGAGAVIVPEHTVGAGYWASVRAYERSFYVGSDAIEAARFFRWEVFEATGGFDETLTGAEDWDLTIAARAIAPITRIAAAIVHDEGAVEYLAACRKKAYYAPGFRRYVAKHGLSTASEALRRPWLRPSALASARGIGLVALKVGEAVASAATLVRAARGPHLRDTPAVQPLQATGGEAQHRGPLQ